MAGFLVLTISIYGCGNVKQGKCSPPCPTDNLVSVRSRSTTGSDAIEVCASSNDPVLSYDATPYSARYYDPEVIPIDRGAITDFHPGKKPLILLNCSQNSLQYLGEYTHKWYGNPRQWTMTILHSLEREWVSRQGKLGGNGEGERLLSLRVTGTHVSWQSDAIECRVSVAVRNGNGDNVIFTAVTRDTDLYGSCDMAISTLVTTILNADEIRDYLLDSGKKQISGSSNGK